MGPLYRIVQKFGTIGVKIDGDRYGVGLPEQYRHMENASKLNSD
ncbi:hypothetical protein FACS1894187_23260 [Synergistales bacterium]|nr:hypothetical protein FACS1894187_23260 [Synergistales bacterium]